MNRRNFIMSLPAAGLAIDGTVPAKGDGFTHTFNDSTLRDASTIEKVKLGMRAMLEMGQGDLGLAQGVCGSPEFNHPGTATEGQAFFLLMEVAYWELEN